MLHGGGELDRRLGGLCLAATTTAEVGLLVATHVEQLLPSTSAAAFTLMQGSRAHAIATGAVVQVLLDAEQHEGRGPGRDTAHSGQPTWVTDARTEDRWPAWAELAGRTGMLSCLSVPVPAEHGVHAAVTVYAQAASAFSVEDAAVVQAELSAVPVTIANLLALQEHLATTEQLREAIRTRAAIEQAKGMLMHAHGITADEAFTQLKVRSNRTNIKLRDLAEALVASANSAGDQCELTRRLRPRDP